MLSVRLLDRTNLVGVKKAIIKAAEKGVAASVDESVEWIKNDVITGGNYVGHQYYPDVTPATKRMKAKKGKTKVLIDTSNYFSSWNGKANGLKGVITGGGQDYAADLYKRGWKLDLLWHAEHSKESEEIIKKAIEKAV
jgi:gamma-glutamyl-gamma-aminobutyrate hydrolase PuuD